MKITLVCIYVYDPVDAQNFSIHTVFVTGGTGTKAEPLPVTLKKMDSG